MLRYRKDVDVLSTINRLAFADDEVFSYKNGLNIAVAFTAYDSEKEWILDRKYGELYFQEQAWGEKADGTFFTSSNRISSAVCTREQLSLTDDMTDDNSVSEFLPLH